MRKRLATFEITVAAHLRSLRSDDPLSKTPQAHQTEIKTVKTIKRTHEL